MTVVVSGKMPDISERATGSCSLIVEKDSIYRRKKDIGFVKQVTKFGNTTKSLFIPITSIISPVSASIIGKKKVTTSTFLNPCENNEISGKTEEMLPFSMYSSSLSADFITNLHEDYYGNDTSSPLQGPFAESNVGGSQYRHYEFTSSTGIRPEGFKIYVKPAGYYVQGPDTEDLNVSNVHLPRAGFYRDEIAKRPVVFRNLRNKNFINRYEYLQSIGRSNINKDLIISGGVGFPSSSAMPFFYFNLTSSIYPLIHHVDYPAVQHARHVNIFTERFSAPGGPETLGTFGQDPTAGEKSPWNCVNFRNYSIRKYNNSNLRQHCGQYGLSGSASTLTYELSASVYKTNRNPLERPVYVYANTDTYKNLVMRQSFDTEYITRSIPRKDSSYLWITSSCNSSSFGYITGSELQFASSSARGVNLQGWGSSSLTELNDILCNQNGVGGWSSWKMIRVGQCRNARFLRENNLITYLVPSKEIEVAISGAL